MLQLYWVTKCSESTVEGKIAFVMYHVTFSPNQSCKTQKRKMCVGREKDVKIIKSLGKGFDDNYSNSSEL